MDYFVEADMRRIVLVPVFLVSLVVQILSAAGEEIPFKSGNSQRQVSSSETATIQPGKPGTFTLTTASGKTYKNCTLRRLENDGVSVVHAGGMSTISNTEITEDIRNLIAAGGPFEPEGWREDDTVRNTKGNYPKLLQYRNVVVKSATPDGVQIIHTGGTEFVPIEALPKTVKDDFELSLDKAKAYRIEQKRKASEEAALVTTAARLNESKVSVSGRILQIVDDGVLVESASLQYVGATEKVQKYVRQPVGLGPTRLDPSRPQQYKTTAYAVEVPKREFIGLIHIACPTDGMLQGQIYQGVIFPKGIYRYETILGGTRFVDGFSTDGN